MLCRRFAVIADVSLLLCIATVAFWIRTLADTTPHLIVGGLSGYSEQVVAFRSQGGFVTLYWITQPQHPFQMPSTDAYVVPNQSASLVVWHWRLDHDNGWPSRLGFAWIRFRPQELRQNLPALSRLIRLGSPHWFIVLLTAMPPAFWLYWRRTRRPSTAGTCGRCGCDLTGNASGVCPECGNSVSRFPATMT